MSFDLAARLAARQADNLYRQRPLLQSPQGPVVTVDGKAYLAFSSNDYLGLANHPKLIEALQITKNKKVIMIRRLFYTDGEPVAYDLKYLPYYKGMPIVEKEIRYATFPEIVSKKTSLFAIKKELIISAQMPDEEIRRHLNIYNELPLMVVEQKLYDIEDKPIGLGITYFRSDYCKLYAQASFRDKTSHE